MIVPRNHRRGEQHSILEHAPILQFAPKPTQVVDVELHRVADPEGPEVTGWTARWGLHGSDRSSADHDEDLAELLRAILDDLVPLSEFYTLTLAWQLGGTAPEGHTVAEAIADAGITLPTSMPQTYA
ncbi:hypothetical protein [Salinifilum ghardaiensis]